MAAIEQIIQIAINERTAAAANTTANNAIPHSAFTVNSDSGVTVGTDADGNPTYTFAAPTAVNLSTVRTFADPAARNTFVGADATEAWHEGDVAIVTTSGPVGGPMLVSGAITSFNNAPTNTVEILMGYNADGTSRLGAPGDMLAFNNNGETDAPSTITFEIDTITPELGTATSAIVSFTTGNTAGIGANATVFTVDGVAETVSSGTWIYTGPDQTAPAATGQADVWTLLQPPANSLTEVSNNYYTASATITGNTAATDQVVITLSESDWTSNFGVGVPTIWPTSSALYSNGLKLVYGTDWRFNADRSEVEILVSAAQQVALGTGTEALVVEMETTT